MPAPYRVAILTVSDTSSQDPSTDKTGPELAGLCNDKSLYAPVERRVVPDDIDKIQSALSEWSATGINLCVTTGGTGFSPRDVTPEAVRPLLVKEATGLQHLMMSTSLTKTPMAALSRPVAGVTKDGMIIVTVPGSPRGAKENLEAILRIIPHALDLVGGGSGKTVHASMGMPQRQTHPADAHQDQQHGHAHLPAPSHSSHYEKHQHHSDNNAHNAAHTHHQSHSHTHGYSHHAPMPRTMRSTDVTQGASARHRVSPYPIIIMDEAFSHIFVHSPNPETFSVPVGDDLLGRILAEDVYSQIDLPSTSTTNVDGYAVSADDTPAGVYRVYTSSNYPYDKHNPSSSILNTRLPKGTIYRINTGGPLPLGTDAVVMVEDTELVSSTGTGGQAEEAEVRILAQVPVGENVRKLGSDVKRGDKVLEKGIRISEIGGEIGTLAFVGKRDALVYRRPIVAIMSTGNEITGLHAAAVGTSKPAADLPVIYDSNRPSLSLILRSHGYEVVDLGIVSDTVAATRQALQLGAERADIVITTGGTSMGEGDLLKPVIERELGGTVHFGRVAMKPGKPTTFATFSSAHPSPSSSKMKQDTLVFALPGNPASALVTFHLFVLPCLRKMSGYPLLGSLESGRGWHLPTVRVRVTTDMRLDPRPEFHRVWIEPDREGDGSCLVARSTGGQRSSRTVSLAGANGLVCLPSSKKEGAKDVKAGDIVDAILMGALGV